MLYLTKAFLDMSKILITGNGFDLFHHLPTKYHHFISIMETIEKFQPTKEATFKDLFGSIFKDKYLNDYNSIIDYYNVEQIKFDNTKIKQIDELLTSNLWYKHFKNVCEIDTWIDFEMEIESVLKQLSYFNKIEDKWDIKKNAFRDKYISFTDFELLNLIKVINTGGAFRFNEKYINQRKSAIDVRKILEDLAKSFEDFIIIFNRYLVDIVCVFYHEVKQKSTIPFHLLNEIYTFNYTPTLEQIYKVEKSKVVYLHGQINDVNTSQNIILGISEMPNQIEISKFFDFTKYYQKVNKNSNKKFIEVPKEIKSSWKETVFYIIGHSLDESDKEYIIDLFNFLKFDNDKFSKICVFYHNHEDRENKLRNLFNILEKNEIVEMDKVGRLYFVELNIENINKEFNRELNTRNFTY